MVEAILNMKMVGGKFDTHMVEGILDMSMVGGILDMHTWKVS